MGVTAAVMQPYLFPYIGYFQLINACDVFISLDNVQYVKRRWMNRNRIIVDRRASAAGFFTFPVVSAPQQTNMCDTYYSDGVTEAQERLLKTLSMCYAGAPYLDAAVELLREAFSFPDRNLARFNLNSLRVICDYLGVKTEFATASELLPACEGGDATERILNLCKAVNASTYINLPGGEELYSAAQFASWGIDLRFMDSAPIAEISYGDEWRLSIIDCLARFSPDEIRAFLDRAALKAGGL
ncbi:MAG: WbqC family protein [Clostridia bacterium]|nr:WbqC family protein [Clostridia bacterium]